MTGLPGFLQRHRRLLFGIATGLFTLLAVAAGGLVLLYRQAEPFLRARIVSALQDRFHARVELDGFHISLTDGLQAEGQGLRIWASAKISAIPEPATIGLGAPGSSVQGEAAPLIRLDRFRFHAPLRWQAGKPIHLSAVELQGLDIHLPAKLQMRSTSLESAGVVGASKASPSLFSFQVDTVVCNNAKLTLATSKPGKLPLEFAITRLALTQIAADGAMHFEAELANPRPVGTIHTSGSFGPWLTADPGESALSGTYRFDHANLGDFKGISGILNSTGRFQGTLRDLRVDGIADVPAFSLTHFGSTLPLHTQFHAQVDATDGDTWLLPVDATLGHSHFTAQGQIVRVLGADSHQSIGHDIALSVIVDRAGIEDFLRLTSHPGTTPLLTGAVSVKATLHIPPGPEPVHERVQVKGSFQLDQARFTSPKIQSRIEELSLRGQGMARDVKAVSAASVLSHMQGSFQLTRGVIGLPALVYSVPGAEIQLHGVYGLEGGTLDFSGTARMKATVSEMVGGWKGLLLKPMDRLFKKNGAGTQISLRITGTREAPEFGIDLDGFKVGVR